MIDSNSSSPTKSKEMPNKKTLDNMRPEKRYRIVNEHTMNRLATHPGESFIQSKWDLQQEFLNFYK